MVDGILSNEQVAIWIEIIEARGSGLPDQELQAIKKSHAALHSQLDISKRLVAVQNKMVDLIHEYIADVVETTIQLEASQGEVVELRVMLDCLATYLERKPHCDEDNCPSRYWATQARQILNAEDEEKMITNGHTD